MRKNTEREPAGSRYDSSLPGATTMHVGFLCIAGIFFASQLIRLIYNQVLGIEVLGTAQFAALVVVMGLLVLFSFVFAGYIWHCIRQTRKENEPSEADSAAAQQTSGTLDAETKSSEADE